MRAARGAGHGPQRDADRPRCAEAGANSSSSAARQRASVTWPRSSSAWASSDRHGTTRGIRDVERQCAPAALVEVVDRLVDPALREPQPAAREHGTRAGEAHVRQQAVGLFEVAELHQRLAQARRRALRGQRPVGGEGERGAGIVSRSGRVAQPQVQRGAQHEHVAVAGAGQRLQGGLEAVGDDQCVHGVV